MKILFVGGTFDDNGGRPSSLAEKVAKSLKECPDTTVTLFNGGHFDTLESILETHTRDADAVLWWCSVPNDKPKIRDVKLYNPKTMLVTSKRNDNQKYCFQELINRALGVKANLCVEFSRQDELFHMLLFDPLGNAWYDGTNIDELADALQNRIKYLKGITRQPCISTGSQKEVPDNEKFFDVVKDYAEVFHNLLHPAEDVTRFLGNSSFRELPRTRCERGFPSFRSGENICVSRRNVDKRFIDKEHFVPVQQGLNSVLYSGDWKPSVDTPIQLKLYEALPNINYMIHAHVYVEDAPFTEHMVPCGGMEEVDEVLTAIQNTSSYTEDFYAINLVGHGCIVMSDDVEKLKNLPFVARKLPELHQDPLIEKDNEPYPTMEEK